MKKSLIFILVFISLAIKAQQPLFIKTLTAIGDKNSFVITKVESKYFDVKFSIMENGNYTAGKTILEYTVKNPNKTILFIISNKIGDAVFFKSSSDFLNYMDARGYDLENQIPNKYGADYTFKKK